MSKSMALSYDDDYYYDLLSLLYIRLLFSILVTLNDIMKSRKYLIVINCIKKVNCFA